MILLNDAQLKSLNSIWLAFEGPEVGDHIFEFVESSLEFLVVRLHAAAVDEPADAAEEASQEIEFGLDEDGGLLLFEWTEEDINAGIWPDVQPAGLFSQPSSNPKQQYISAGWAYYAAVRPLPAGAALK